MPLPPLRLRRNEDRRIRAGHLWVFSNEVDTDSTPLTAFEPGDAVEIQDSRGSLIGAGYVNPRSLISARMVTRGGRESLNRELLLARLRRALALRTRLFPEPAYRLVFGESDGLPGLIVDRFGDVAVAQITTAGMERLRADVVDAIVEVLSVRAVLLRNDTAARTLEGLELYVESAHGEPPERVEIEENGARFAVPLLAGQKTGWFFDHRSNRARMQRYAARRRVLDLFSYIGGWGIQAAVAGADHVLCVDASGAAVEELGHSLHLNPGSAGRVSTRVADAFEALRELRDGGERFDLIVLDPPAFITRKKDQKAGAQAYRRINQLALRLLTADGILVTASCSYHFGRSGLRDALLRAGRSAEREVQILEQGHQAPDHPVHPAIPETDYLKAFIARVE
jgi:23S rRNA (cytosine1962-C5)-methyltransferase